jgi:mRNA-degrading endonuclease RelE of RelBE toxin-antitoxin system
MRALAPGVKRKVKVALAELAKEPNPPGPTGNLKRLDTPGSGEPVFRARIGDYRAVYVVRGRDVRVLRLFHREEGYDWLRRLRLD